MAKTTIRRHIFIIPLVLDAAAGKRPYIKVFGTDYNTRDGSCIRDYIHVNDLVDAPIRVLRHLQNGRESDYFNQGNIRGTSVLEVIDSVKRVSDQNFNVTYAPGDPATLAGSSEKARQTLVGSPSLPTSAPPWNTHGNDTVRRTVDSKFAEVIRSNRR